MKEDEDGLSGPIHRNLDCLELNGKS